MYQLRNQKTLKTLSVELGTRLGFVVTSNQTYNIQAPLLHSFLQDAAEQLHEQFGNQLLREQDYTLTLTSGKNRYALPRECDPYRLNDISVQINGVYQSLRQGITTQARNATISNTFPQRWQIVYDDASEVVPQVAFDQWIEETVPVGWTKSGTHDSTNYVRPYDDSADQKPARGITFTGDDAQQAGIEIDGAVSNVDYIVEYEYSDKTTGELEILLGGTATTLSAGAGVRKKVKITAGSGDDSILVRPVDGTSMDCTLVYLSVSLASERPRFAIEIWPTPEDTYTARLDFYRQLGAFSEDEDVCPVHPSRLVFLHALVNAKAHYDQPDAQVYIPQMEQLLRQIRGRQFAGERFFVETPYHKTDPYSINYSDVQATFSPYVSLVDSDDDFLLDG